MTPNPKMSKSVLRKAIDWAEENYPLPRCVHGNALKDGAGERLEPNCGCRAWNTRAKKGER